MDWLLGYFIRSRYVHTSFAQIRQSHFESCLEQTYNPSAHNELRVYLRGRHLGTVIKMKVLVERWRREYNHIRPHSSLGYRPPAPGVIIPM